jgi:hypothetical protein
MVQYYTLEQAAQLLRTSPEKLKEMAKKGEVRPFQDRGTLRFRVQEIDELVRLKGIGSDPELQFSEVLAPPAKPATPATSGKQTSIAPVDTGSKDFVLDPGDSDAAAIGEEVGPKSGSGRSGRSPRPRPAGPKSPPPKASSDSDVRLVSDSSDLNFQIEPEGSVQMGKAPAVPSSGSQKGKTEAKADSGVRIVPLDKASDSDVKIVPDDADVPIGAPATKAPSDSDIRLEPHTPVGPRSGTAPGSDPSLVTEEIDLDAEARKAEDSARAKARAKSKVHRKPPEAAKASPFELSDSDLDMKPAPAGKGAGPLQKPVEADSSSDFELAPVGDSPIEPSSDEVPILAGEDEVRLGDDHARAGDSGINLGEPADSGISLESQGDEFELAPAAGKTPQPGPLHVERDSSSSEFELSPEEGAAVEEKPDSSSEFELSLDAVDERPKEDSDSEFELTLDDSGALAPLEDSSVNEQEKDIFETDFEVPALEEESGSEAVALEEGTGSESSDFDMDMSDESGSQVVSLEDEPEADELAATQTAGPRRRDAGLLEDSGPGLEAPELEEEEEEEELVTGRVPVTAAAPPAEWGALPGVVLLIGLPILFLVTLMGFEMLQTQHGYHKPGALTGAFARMMDDSLPKD